VNPDSGASEASAGERTQTRLTEGHRTRARPPQWHLRFGWTMRLFLSDPQRQPENIASTLQ
jgi:hypothetical protein